MGKKSRKRRERNVHKNKYEVHSKAAKIRSQMERDALAREIEEKEFKKRLRRGYGDPFARPKRSGVYRGIF